MIDLAVIGGGPAGLRAAEVAAARGLRVTVFDCKPSVGRKFLVAGKGGLNLTHSEPANAFAARYRGADLPQDLWKSLLAKVDAAAVREWARSHGVETFVASTGRIYPRELKAAPLLRSLVATLRTAGVAFAMRHRWCGLDPGAPIKLRFETPDGTSVLETKSVVLALGGGSWPQTGSDGAWVQPLTALGISVAELQPANCGWEFCWPPEVLAVAEGLPLKSIAAEAGGCRVRGELLLTSYGLEGGAIYQLGPYLRALPSPTVTIDFKPDSTVAQLVKKMGPIRRNFLAEARDRWRLSESVMSIFTHLPQCGPWASAESLARQLKALPLTLAGPRPIAEAISTAGGVAWSELDEGLMLRRLPGVFIAGEMIDWEAPTGGYLLHGCLATGAHAGEAAAAWIASAEQRRLN